MSPNIGSVLRSVTPAALKQLAAACRESAVLSNVASHVIEQILGSQMAVEARAALSHLHDAGWTSEQAAFLLEEVASATDAANPTECGYELVLSGPDLDGVHVRDTFAVVNELFVRAKAEVILIGYAVHNGQVLFHRLAERLEQCPSLQVSMYLDIPRRSTDSSLSDQIVRRFVHEFFTRHWPWTTRPTLYYDTRSLETSLGHRSSLHAKCLVVDRSSAFITSANFTSAAQDRNIEAGILVEHGSCISSLLSYLEGLRASGIIRQVPDYARDLSSP